MGFSQRSSINSLKSCIVKRSILSVVVLCIKSIVNSSFSSLSKYSSGSWAFLKNCIKKFWTTWIPGQTLHLWIIQISDSLIYTIMYCAYTNRMRTLRPSKNTPFGSKTAKLWKANFMVRVHKFVRSELHKINLFDICCFFCQS